MDLEKEINYPNKNKSSKNCHGIDMKIRLNGHVTKESVKIAIEKFVQDTPTWNRIKILAIVLMAHGGEDDW